MELQPTSLVHGGIARRLPDRSAMARSHPTLPSLSLPLRGFNKAEQSRPVTAASVHYEQLHQIQEAMRAKAAQEACMLRTELQITLRRAECAEAQLQQLQQQPPAGQSAVAAPASVPASPSEKGELAALQQQLQDAMTTVELLRSECADTRREAQLYRRQNVSLRQRDATEAREAKSQRARADAATEACRLMRGSMAWHRAELLRLRQEVVSLSGVVAEACSSCEAASKRCIAASAAVVASPEEVPVASRRQVEEQILQRMLAQGLPDRQARLLVGLPPAAGQSRGERGDSHSSLARRRALPPRQV